MPGALSTEAVADAIAGYVISHHDSTFDKESLPREKSLLELGIIDSYGVIELVEYLEETWDITIDDSDLTKDKMGSITKMATLVVGKLAGKEQAV